MSDDLFGSDIADQLCHDLLVECLTDTDSTEVSGDLEKAVSFSGVLKIASGAMHFITCPRGSARVGLRLREQCIRDLAC